MSIIPSITAFIVFLLPGLALTRILQPSATKTEKAAYTASFGVSCIVILGLILALPPLAPLTGGFSYKTLIISSLILTLLLHLTKIRLDKAASKNEDARKGKKR
ncbi:Uncharacterised protein [uncultured archaeon]|nr:Uncharacterised protein [uncultured archaeon]